MLRGRSIATNYFRDPEGLPRSSGDVRCVLVDLVLQANEYGHALDCPPATMEAALAERGQVGLLQCSQVGKHASSVLTSWVGWQPLTKRTPSRYPAPPTQEGQA